MRDDHTHVGESPETNTLQCRRNDHAALTTKRSGNIGGYSKSDSRQTVSLTRTWEAPRDNHSDLQTKRLRGTQGTRGKNGSQQEGCRKAHRGLWEVSDQDPTPPLLVHTLLLRFGVPVRSVSSRQILDPPVCRPPWLSKGHGQ